MEPPAQPPPSSPPPPKPSLPNQSQFTVPTSVVFSKLKASLFSPNSRPPNPNPNSRPFSSNSAFRRLNVDCSDSETSIGSSSYNVIGSNPGRTLHSEPHRVPLSEIGNRSDSVFGPKVTQFRRKKAPEKTKDKGKQIPLPLAIDSAEKTRFKGKPSDVSTGKTKDIGNLSGTKVSEYRRKNAPDKTKDRKEEFSLPLTLYSAEKTRVKGKPSGVGKTKDLEMVIPTDISCNSIVNTRNKKKENVVPSSCPPLLRTRNKRCVSYEAENARASHSLTTSQPKGNKKKRRVSAKENDSVNALPKEYVEQQRAYFKEIDDFELVEEEASDDE